MDNKIVFQNFDFADSEYKSYNMSENSVLTINMYTWQEVPFKIVFKDTIYFSYELGDGIENVYEVPDNAQFFYGALLRNYTEKPPLDHPYKGFEIRDLYDFAFIKIVAESALITIETES